VSKLDDLLRNESNGEAMTMGKLFRNIHPIADVRIPLKNRSWITENHHE
jgi:hypothetical protein